MTIKMYTELLDATLKLEVMRLQKKSTR